MALGLRPGLAAGDQLGTVAWVLTLPGDRQPQGPVGRTLCLDVDMNALFVG